LDSELNEVRERKASSRFISTLAYSIPLELLKRVCFTFPLVRKIIISEIGGSSTAGMQGSF